MNEFWFTFDPVAVCTSYILRMYRFNTVVRLLQIIGFIELDYKYIHIYVASLNCYNYQPTDTQPEYEYFITRNCLVKASATLHTVHYWLLQCANIIKFIYSVLFDAHCIDAATTCSTGACVCVCVSASCNGFIFSFRVLHFLLTPITFFFSFFSAWHVCVCSLFNYYASTVAAAAAALSVNQVHSFISFICIIAVFGSFSYCWLPWPNWWIHWLYFCMRSVMRMVARKKNM